MPLIASPSIRHLVLAACLGAASVSAGIASASDIYPQGLAIGDVRAHSAVVWTRAPLGGEVRLDVSATDGGDVAFSAVATARPTNDHVLHWAVDSLAPATSYRVVLTAVGAPDGTLEGQFTTAPEPTADALATVLVGGDLGGQGYCRHVERGYLIFQAMLEREADLFIANGDMIYADGLCPAEGPDGWRNVPGAFANVLDLDWSAEAPAGAALSPVEEAIAAHWHYNRADAAHRAFLARTPMVAQWDDHEVINDFGFAWASWPLDPERPGWRHLVEAGREAVFRYNPIEQSAGEARRIERSFRWGQHLELFVLDARTYRDPNSQLDGPDKAVLGAEQVAWLVDGLTASKATWKLVSSNIPLALATGSRADLWGRDGFANGLRDDFSRRTGGERELLDLLARLDAADVENLVVLATDVHHAMILRTIRDFDGDGDVLRFHEVIVGPLNAGMAPAVASPDPTLGSVVLFGEAGVFNFGEVRLVRRGEGPPRLVAEVRGEDGQIRDGSTLELAPRPSADD